MCKPAHCCCQQLNLLVLLLWKNAASGRDCGIIVRRVLLWHRQWDIWFLCTPEENHENFVREATQRTENLFASLLTCLELSICNDVYDNLTTTIMHVKKKTNRINWVTVLLQNDSKNTLKDRRTCSSCACHADYSRHMCQFFVSQWMTFWVRLLKSSMNRTWRKKVENK